MRDVTSGHNCPLQNLVGASPPKRFKVVRGWPESNPALVHQHCDSAAVDSTRK